MSNVHGDKSTTESLVSMMQQMMQRMDKNEKELSIPGLLHMYSQSLIDVKWKGQNTRGVQLFAGDVEREVTMPEIATLSNPVSSRETNHPCCWESGLQGY